MMENSALTTQHIYVIDDDWWQNILMGKMLERKVYPVCTVTEGVCLVEHIRRLASVIKCVVNATLSNEY